MLETLTIKGLPMPEYSFLEITMMNKCPVDCYYCPQDTYQKAYHGKPLLTMEDFKTILPKIPKNVALAFSGYSELKFPEVVDMIELASNEGYEVMLNSTLVGANHEDIDRLSRIKLKQCVLHLPDKRMKTFVKSEILIHGLMALNVTGLSIHNENFISNGRAGLSREAPNIDVEGRFYCHKLKIPQFVMLPNGDVFLCCMDFGLKHRLGNLITNNLGRNSK